MVVGGGACVKLWRGSGLKQTSCESGAPPKQALKERRLFHQRSLHSHREGPVIASITVQRRRLKFQEAQGWGKCERRIAARDPVKANFSTCALSLAHSALLEEGCMGAVFVLGFGEDSQMAAPPHAWPQAPGLLLKKKTKTIHCPVPRLRLFRP